MVWKSKTHKQHTFTQHRWWWASNLWRVNIYYRWI